MSAAKKLAPKKDPAARARVEPLISRRVLVVEDEREIGKVYRDILGSRGPQTTLRSSRGASATPVTQASPSEFEVVVVTQADEALAHVKQSLAQGNPFAMGFIDVLLGPGMDGIELVKKIHEDDPRLHAVFVTAYQDRSVDAISQLLGSKMTSRWDYLNKPFSPGEILQKARNFVSLWNLEREREVREGLLSEAHRRLLDHERAVSVAAVARGVSHEFGNILMQIMGKADLARAKKPEDMREAFERILEATHRAGEILDRFKNLSAPVHARGGRDVVRLPDLVNEALDLMEHTLKVGQIKVCRIKMDPALAEVNSTGILQVLVNLIINAHHAMGDNGQLDVSITDLGAMVELRVRDYGPGIPASLIEKVMEPFFTTKGDKGTGLGLSICREIIEVEHQGEFEIRNHPAKGLEVVIRLPKSEEPLEEVT